MAIEVLPEWMTNLDDEDITFTKRFLLASGSLKEIQINMVLPIRLLG